MDPALVKVMIGDGVPAGSLTSPSLLRHYGKVKLLWSSTWNSVFLIQVSKKRD